MAEPIIREWLADCKKPLQAGSKHKAVSPTEVHSFSCIIVQNNELIQGIFSILEDRTKQHELLESVCNQLFGFFRSKEAELHRFALQFLPAMIGAYLASVAQGDKLNVKCIEVLLLGVYNLEVVDTHGKAKTHSFRMPCVAQPSIYHTPISLSSAALTENALSRLEKSDNQVIAIGPFPQVESLNAQNRMKVMTVLMNVYNRNLSYMPKTALQALCKMCMRVAKQGFGKQGSHHRSSYGTDNVFGGPYARPPCRIPLTSSFLLEVIHGVYFSMFNGLGVVGLQALDEAHARATHDLMAEVLLVTNGVRNSLHANPSGQPSDGPMGISISLSPTTSMNTVSKSIVTNASFRTKKLPDDIPIQVGGTPGSSSAKEGDGGDGQKNLATISEEAGADNDNAGDNRSSSHQSGKPKDKSMMDKIKTKMGGVGKRAESDHAGASGKASSNGSSAGADANDVGLKIKIDGVKVKSKVVGGSSSPSIQNGDTSANFTTTQGQTKDAVGVRNPLITPRTQSRSSLTTDSVEMKNLMMSGSGGRMPAPSPLLSKSRASSMVVTSANDLDGHVSDESGGAGGGNGSISSAHSSMDEDKGSTSSASPRLSVVVTSKDGQGHRRSQQRHNQDGSIPSLSETQTVV